MLASDCPFCSPDPERVLDEQHLVRIIGDAFPVNPGHCLVTPARHVTRWDDVRGDEKQAILAAVDRAIAIVRRAHPADGFNVGWNDGHTAGQTVPHLHVHVIPRLVGDVADPRGGIRAVVPARARYWEPARPRPPHERALVTGGPDPLLPHLSALFPRAMKVEIAVAFIVYQGLRKIRHDLVDLLARGAKLRLVTGDYLDFTDPNALHRLLDLDGDCDLRVFETAGQSSFHPKAYIFHLADGDGVAFVGSSNISETALGDGIEWNYRILRARDRGGFEDVVNAFEALRSDSRTRRLTGDWIDRYAARRRPHPGAGIPDEPLPERPEPLPIQEEALLALAETRNSGHRSGLVVLATGLGKTWLSAFDSASSDRVLFVAHRSEILEQAIAVYRLVQPIRRIGRFTGADKDPEADVLFASVQTLSRSHHLWSFPRNRFDYVVVDEFHHASARTYRRLIEHFEPRFLLGLTATPERSDGGDLLALCGDNLVYRCDLAAAIERGALTPFHYFGVPDDVDYDQIPWRSHRFDEDQLTDALATRRRAENALQQLEARGGQRTLAFCCSLRHADFMARFFADRGKRAVAVHSGRSSAPRAQSLEELEAGKLDVVCCVDMFNEGVDLPLLDTVLMLRPTESRVLWLQQIGRGLRKHAQKPHLTIVDYIGNHRAFLEKPRALLSVLVEGIDHPDQLRHALRRLEAGELELPPGCAVTYELEAVRILERLLAPSTAEQRLVEFYRAFRERHEVRPAASETFVAGVMSKQVLSRAFGSWFGLVSREGDLDSAGARVLARHDTLLREVETAQMVKSYKMLVLLALLDADQVPGSLSIDELAPRVAAIAQRSVVYRRDFGDKLEDLAALRQLLRSQPIPAWTGANRKRSSDFFRHTGERFTLEADIDPSDRPALADMLRELAEWRLVEYRDRVREDRFECRVFSNRRDPILKLPDRDEHPYLPEGDVPVWADGDRYDARFAKIAINTARKPGQAGNALPGILRGWFGERAGEPGRRDSVVCERFEDGYRMRPRLGDVSEVSRVHDEDDHALDATFRLERSGDAVSLVFFSRGGTRGSKAQRNADYNAGLEVLLGRMARLGIRIAEVQLETEAVQPSTSRTDRRLTIEGRRYPIDLQQESDLTDLRRALGRAQAQAGRKPGAKGAGNSTKTIRLLLDMVATGRPGDLAEQLSRRVEKPDSQ